MDLGRFRLAFRSRSCSRRLLSTLGEGKTETSESTRTIDRTKPRSYERAYERAYEQTHERAHERAYETTDGQRAPKSLQHEPFIMLLDYVVVWRRERIAKDENEQDASMDGEGNELERMEASRASKPTGREQGASMDTKHGLELGSGSDVHSLSAESKPLVQQQCLLSLSHAYITMTVYVVSNSKARVSRE